MLFRSCYVIPSQCSPKWPAQNCSGLDTTISFSSETGLGSSASTISPVSGRRAWALRPLRRTHTSGSGLIEGVAPAKIGTWLQMRRSGGETFTDPLENAGWKLRSCCRCFSAHYALHLKVAVPPSPSKTRPSLSVPPPTIATASPRMSAIVCRHPQAMPKIFLL